MNYWAIFWMLAPVAACIGNLWKLTPKGIEAAKKIPDIDEPMCIPTTNIQF